MAAAIVMRDSTLRGGDTLRGNVVVDEGETNGVRIEFTEPQWLHFTEKQWLAYVSGGSHHG